MKPTLVLAGLPRYTLRKRDPSFQGWFEALEDVFIPQLIWSESKEVTLEPCWDQVEDVAKACEESADGSLHVLLFHKDRNDRGRYRDRLSLSHRMRFLPTSLLSTFGQTGFRDAILDQLCIEARWREIVCPGDIKHPLILPNRYFSTTAFFSAAWDRSATTESLDDIAEIGSLLAEFREKHLATAASGSALSAYFDLSANYFKFPRTIDYHGISDSPQENWKFTLRVPDGFHYDVGPASGKGEFAVTGPQGRHVYSDNVNIYPNGAVRA